MAPTTDNFNRADENPIGSPWNNIVENGGVRLFSNRVIGITGAAARNTNYYTTATRDFTADQYSQYEYAGTSTSSSHQNGPTVRCDEGGANSYYCVRVYDDNFELFKVVTGTFTQIGTGTPTITNPTAIKLEVVGTTLEVFVGGVSQGTNSDSALADGQPGIHHTGNNTLAYANDWEGDDIAAGSSVVILRRRREGY